MRLFQSLSVGIVLTTLCFPAIADIVLPNTTNEPLIDSKVWNAREPVVTLPRVYQPTDVKSENLQLAYEIAKPFGFPGVIQGILLQESNGGDTKTLVGGKHLAPDKRSYGVMQVQTVAAKSVFKYHPELLDKFFPGKTLSAIRDRDIIKLLLDNAEANITIAVYHYNVYLRLLKGNHTKTIAAYNVGIGGVRKIRTPQRFRYVASVQQKIRTVVIPFNQQYNLP